MLLSEFLAMPPIAEGGRRVATSRAFQPLLEPADWKGAWGGRGSGKTHFFGELAVEEAVRFPGDTGEGLRMVCIREVQKDLSQSSKLIIEDKIAKNRLGIADGFKIYRDVIETPKDGQIIFKGMNDYTAESAKSLERFKRAWIDEAQTLSARSLSLIGPTIHRWPGSEIWASWNPRRKKDPVDDFFRVKKPAGSVCVEANWRDNPFWNESAEKQRLLELQHYPERYEHTYEGGYAKAFEGAYFARELAQARMEGRIGKGRIGTDPLLPVKAIFDIGGAGAKADAMAIWITQWVGREIRILDYIEGQSQALAYYVNELRSRGWGKAVIYLPHDGLNTSAVTGKQYSDHWKDAGFEVPDPVPNQGAGAAMQRIEALRRLFPQLQFSDTPAVTGGLDAIGFYHERKDEARNIGLGPEHDWSSHAADALGMLAIIYEAPTMQKPRDRYSGRRMSGSGSWESA